MSWRTKLKISQVSTSGFISSLSVLRERFPRPTSTKIGDETMQRLDPLLGCSFHPTSTKILWLNKKKIEKIYSKSSIYRTKMKYCVENCPNIFKKWMKNANYWGKQKFWKHDKLWNKIWDPKNAQLWKKHKMDEKYKIWQIYFEENITWI